MSTAHSFCKHENTAQPAVAWTDTILSEVPYLNLRIIKVSNLNMNESINDIFLMDRLGVLKKSQSGSTMNDLSQENYVSIRRVQTIISQRSLITKRSRPRVSRRYLALEDRLKVICRAERV